MLLGNHCEKQKAVGGNLVSKRCPTHCETMKTVTDFIFLGPKSLQMVTAVMKLKDPHSLGEKL